jgi:hypothetical protein
VCALGNRSGLWCHHKQANQEKTIELSLMPVLRQGIAIIALHDSDHSDHSGEFSVLLNSNDNRLSGPGWAMVSLPTCSTDHSTSRQLIRTTVVIGIVRQNLR